MSDSEARRRRVLAEIATAGARGISGETIAERLECSRAAVHRHVVALRGEGVDIVGAHDGYALAPGADPVVAQLVLPRLVPPLAGPVHWSASTGSTNDDVARAAREGAPEGLVIGADLQTAGRGRRGREWRAAPGDALTFSVLLRPPVSPVDAALLPLVVALAVAEGIGPDALITWPNDILVGGRKVCGILCESSIDESGVAWAVAGIGINVRAAPDLADARWRAGTVPGTPRRGDLLVAVLTALSHRYAQWSAHGSGSVVSAWAARDGLAGREVTVALAQGELRGVARGIDDYGRLVVAVGDSLESVGSGEVIRVAW